MGFSLLRANSVREDSYFDLERLLPELEIGEVVVGPVAFGLATTPGLEEIVDGYYHLRKLVYARKGGILDVRDESPTTDADSEDDRSIHIAAVERTVAGHRVVASTRLIVQTPAEGSTAATQTADTFFENSSRALPAHLEFAGEIAPVDPDSYGFEVSRYILRRPRMASRALVARALHDSIAATANRWGKGVTVAVVEDWLEEQLLNAGVGVERATSERFLEQYGTNNVVVAVDVARIDRRIGERPTTFRVPPLPQQVPARFGRNLGFWSVEEQEVLRHSHVAIAGVGGDGYQLGLALVRMGVGALTITDPEVFEAENMNRVPGARLGNIGRSKSQCFVEDALEIDSDVSISVVDGGVSQDNVTDFVSKADLVIDETELTRLEIGAMLSDECCRQKVPVLVVMNVGFAGQVTAYHPSGPGFREMMGIPADEGLEHVAKRHVEFGRCIPYLAPYTDGDVLEAVENGAPLPSITQGVNQAVALGASQAFLWLTRGVANKRPEPVTYPAVRYVDSLTGESGTVLDVPDGFDRSLTRMSASSKERKTPRVRYPIEAQQTLS